MHSENSEIIICLDSSTNKSKVFRLLFNLNQSLGRLPFFKICKSIVFSFSFFFARSYVVTDKALSSRNPRYGQSSLFI